MAEVKVLKKGTLEFQSRAQEDPGHKDYFQKKNHDQLKPVFTTTHIILKSPNVEKRGSDEWSSEGAMCLWAQICRDEGELKAKIQKEPLLTC